MKNVSTPLKINATRFIFHVTFDRSEIESCGFHRCKEKTKVHRIICYRLFDTVSLRFSMELFEKQRS
jgi:hypothetical protein